MERQSVLQPAYKYIYDMFDGSEMLMGMTVSYLLLVGVFWSVGGFFLLTDLTGKPTWMTRYKVQTDANVPLDQVKLRKVLKTVLFNNIVLNAIFAYPIYRQQVHAGCSFAVDDTPRWPTILRDLAFCTIVQEIVFYYSHRLFHHPWIYKAVHKKHHQWTAPIGIVAIYATPLEYLTGNGLSVFLGPLIARSHIVFWWIWYTLAITVTVIHHSGYHLPFLPSPQFHDYHHLTYNWNFGTLGILDWLHGTDAGFRKTVQRKRHRMLWHLKPIHKLFPERLTNGANTSQNGITQPQQLNDHNQPRRSRRRNGKMKKKGRRNRKKKWNRWNRQTMQGNMNSMELNWLSSNGEVDSISLADLFEHGNLQPLSSNQLETTGFEKTVHVIDIDTRSSDNVVVVIQTQVHY